MDGSWMRGGFGRSIKNAEKYDITSGVLEPSHNRQDIRPRFDDPLAMARHLKDDMATAGQNIQHIYARQNQAKLPKALVNVLKATRKTTHKALSEAKKQSYKHFPLLVIGDCIGEQLRPYQSIRGHPCHHDMQDIEAYWRDITHDIEAEYIEYRQFGGELTDVKAFAKVIGCESRMIEGALHIGYWVNPHTKWKAWEIGGAFHGRLHVNSRSDVVDQALFGDLNFAAMRTHNRHHVEKLYDQAKESPDFAIKLGVDLSKPRAQHVLMHLQRHPLLAPAVLKQGEWFDIGGDLSKEPDHEKWLDCFEDLIAGVSPSTLITIVDCSF